MSKVYTPVFRASFPNVFKARKNDLNGKDEYSVVALFPKGTDLTELKKAAEAAVKEKWGADPAKWPKLLKSPFRDQAEREKEGKLPQGYEAGAIFMNLKSTQKPGLIKHENGQAVDITDSSEFYAGCYAKATVRAYAYDQKGNKGVAFGLQNILKVKDGDPIGNRSKPEDDFKPVAATESTEGAPAGGTSATSLFS
jgi:hypothetical protein